ncbi:MAG: 16S rRNA (guanine(527)-N(7))-methyltransferase RsmG [Gammaproteobacteria bacterium]|nr:MAG: 16S rRNA (guanine(527)-N(7))-methyltransferase RsmG [Gammaproteobacteria bacterium]
MSGQDYTSLWSDQLAQGLAQLNLSLDADRCEALYGYLRLMQRWNAAYNLTAVRDPAQWMHRHVLDALSILPWIKGHRWADVGTGGGIPGMVLALVRPDTRWTLIDSNGKKTRFLTQCVLELKPGNVEVIHDRVENVQLAGPLDGVTSRAFTALENMVRWCGPLLGPRTPLLAMKGQYPEAEIRALPPEWRVTGSHALKVPGNEGARHLIILSRDAHAGA